MNRTMPAALAIALLAAPLNSENGTVRAVILGKQYTFFIHELRYGGSGTIISGILAKKVTVRAEHNLITFAAGNELQFFESGAPAIGCLAGDHKLTVGSVPIGFKGGTRIDLHESGAVDSGYLAKDTLLRVGRNRVLLKRGLEEIDKIGFSPSGRIIRGMLAKPSRILAGAKAYAMAWEIGFYESGRVEWGHFSRDTELTVGKNRLTIAGNEYHDVEFYENGEIMKAYLADDQVASVGGLPVALCCTIEFRRGGWIAAGHLAKEFSFQGRTFGQFRTIVFSYSKSGALAGAEEYQHPKR